MHEAIHLFEHAIRITAFVAVMMVAIEYVNVYLNGTWMQSLSKGRLRQYLFGVAMGVIPGCLGSFVVVALYGNKRVTLGTVVATMIATSGDEAFVMFAEIPGVAAGMTAGLAVVGILAGLITDQFLSHGPGADTCDGFEIHDHEPGHSFNLKAIVGQWRSPSPHRAVMAFSLVVYFVALLSGDGGHHGAGWDWYTMLAVVAFGLFVVTTVPDHFLDDHLWGHVIKKHVPRIFLWTIGALIAILLVTHFTDPSQLIADNPWLVLLIAVLLGLIPESGPHLIFVLLYAQGTLPLSILVASSAVQDGHGALPLLAFSRSDFIRVKLINAVVGLLLGGAMMAAGF